MTFTFLAFLVAASLAVSACGRQPVETVPAATVTLTFVVGDPSRWPRRGTQFQDQIVDRVRREVCWVKYRDARTFECWRPCSPHVRVVVPSRVEEPDTHGARTRAKRRTGEAVALGSGCDQVSWHSRRSRHTAAK